MRLIHDELGHPVRLPVNGPTEVVSLVPSLTESIEATVPGVLVGATDYCVHPPDLITTRIGGSKYPKVDEIVALRPQLARADVHGLVLPDEPYPFTDDDGPEEFPGVRYALVSGRCLTWWGPSLLVARTALGTALARRF